MEIRTKEPVKELIHDGQHVQGVKLASGKTVKAHAVIVATGGKSVPQTGSTGDGYPWAESAGHTITELYPTEVPIVSGESWIQSKELQGLSLRDVGLSVLDAKGKTVISHRGDMIFTHFGVSGPIALRCSQFIRKVQMKSGSTQVMMSIDFFPDLTPAALERQVQQVLEQESRKAVKNILKTWVPERMIPLLMKRAEISEDLTFHHFPKGMLSTLCGLMKSLPSAWMAHVLLKKPSSLAEVCT